MVTSKKSLNTFIRVVYALTLREISATYGGTHLGYLWPLIQNIIGIMIYWGIRTFFHFHAPHGMNTLTFLVTGFGTWNIISNTIKKIMPIPSNSKSLLVFPHIFILDIILTRTIVIFATQLVSMVIILFFGAAVGFEITIDNPGLLLFAILLASSLGLGAGIFLMALGCYFPIIYTIVPIILRLLFFVSGVFFSVTRFTKRIGDFLYWNPILQIIEIVRTSMCHSYPSMFSNIAYLITVVITLLTMGLLLERYVRVRTQQ